MSRTVKRLLLGGTLAAGALLLSVAAAYACTPAEIDLDEGAAVPGEAIRGTGTGWSGIGGPVEIHFDSLRDNVVWTGRPATTGSTIQFSFEVPAVDPGFYTIVATQEAATGGTDIARARLKVLPATSTEPQTTGPVTRSQPGGAGSGSKASVPTETGSVGTAPAAPVAAPPAAATKESGRVQQAKADRPGSARNPRPAAAAPRQAAIGAAPVGDTPNLNGAAGMALVLLATVLLLSISGLAFVLARRRSTEQEPATAEVHHSRDR